MSTIESSIGSLIEMDQQEAALKEQLQKLALKKQEARKTEGERAREELRRKIPDTRFTLFGLLRTARSLEIILDDEYAVTLRRILQDAGASGAPLSLVQEVLPDLERLQAARDELGKNGTGEIVELRAKEHLAEGRGRGLFLVWNDTGTAPLTNLSRDQGVEDVPSEPDETASPATTRPAPKPAPRR